MQKTHDRFAVKNPALRTAARLVLVALLWLPAQSSRSELLPAFEVSGHVGWSVDAGGPAEGMDIEVPPDSTIIAAHLYCATALGTPAPPGVTPEVVVEGVSYGPSEFVPLAFLGFPGFETGMQAFRADARSQVEEIVSGGDFEVIHLDVESVVSPLGRATGLLLAVIYKNESLPRRQIQIWDGAADLAGIAAVIELPPRPVDDAPETLMSLGISFSSGSGDQKTLVEINGRRLTSVAGGADDAPFGGLTVGGYMDSPANPEDPFHSPLIAGDLDDELYDLSRGNSVDEAPFLTAGETLFEITLDNPSMDDHTFFLGIRANLAELPVTEIPTLQKTAQVLLAAMLALLGWIVLAGRPRA